MCNGMKHGVLTLVRLKRRADFLRVARTGRRYAAPGLVLQVAPKAAPGLSCQVEEVEATLGIGFTVSKKVGNAVARNRAKRRLRAVVADVMPGQAAASRDFVLIGRKATLRRSFADLKQDLLKALRQTKSLAAADARAAS